MNFKKVLFIFILSIYVFNTNVLYSQETTNTTINNNSQNEITINGVKYAPITTPSNSTNTASTTTPVDTSTQKQSTPNLAIDDLIVGGYVSAGYLFNLGSTYKSSITFYKYKDPNYYGPSDSREEELNTDSSNGNAFYVKVGYQSIMAGVEVELKSTSDLSNTFESQIDPKYNVRVYNYSPEFGFNFYLDFLSSKQYLLAPVFGVSTAKFATQTLSDGKVYKDNYFPNFGIKYGILYRQFVYKNFGFEASWYGMSRFSNHKIEGWDYISEGHHKLITNFHNSELSIGLVYDF